MKTKDGFDWKPGDKTYSVRMNGDIDECQLATDGYVESTYMHKCNAMLEAATVMERYAADLNSRAKEYRWAAEGCHHQVSQERKDALRASIPDLSTLLQLAKENPPPASYFEGEMENPFED